MAIHPVKVLQSNLSLASSAIRESEVGCWGCCCGLLSVQAENNLPAGNSCPPCKPSFGAHDRHERAVLCCINEIRVPKVYCFIAGDTFHSALFLDHEVPPEKACP